MKKKKRKQETLNEILHEAWAMLERGAGHFKDPFHCPVLGSLGKNECSQRTVILREFLLPDRVLVCHTDKRAGKAEEITRSGKASWLFYHPKKKIQLRITGSATLHTTDRYSDEQWAATSLTSRINYCAIKPPGTPVENPISGLPDFLLNKVPTLLESEKGRGNFMAIRSQIHSLEWVSLSILGNKRARFQWHENGLHSTWLIP